MVKNSDFDTGIRPKSRNKILTLSTCTDHDSSKRFAVHAVCIDTQKTSEE
ncbi:sortase [Ruminococcus sp. OM04-4AA]|nr:sortase [Ruminococcus sp. OM04-4AA]